MLADFSCVRVLRVCVCIPNVFRMYFIVILLCTCNNFKLCSFTSPHTTTIEIVHYFLHKIFRKSNANAREEEKKILLFVHTSGMRDRIMVSNSVNGIIKVNGRMRVAGGVTYNTHTHTHNDKWRIGGRCDCGFPRD